MSVEYRSLSVRAAVSVGVSSAPGSSTLELSLATASLQRDETKSSGVSVVISAYNEEARLGSTLEKYLCALEEKRIPFEIVVVVDGATDRTSEVARSFSSRNVVVMEFPKRLRKGGAIKVGMKHSRYPIVGYQDADGPIPASEVYAMLDVLDNVDCVVASRLLSESKIANPQPFGRRVLGRAWSSLVRALFLLPIKDTQCGAKFFRRSVVVPALEQLRSRSGHLT